jgi:hypothetical protein
MKEILCYIAGIISACFLFPIGSKLLEVVLLCLESLKTRSQKRILNGNKEMIMMQEFMQEPDEVPDYDVVYLDDEDDEE